MRVQSSNPSLLMNATMLSKKNVYVLIVWDLTHVIDARPKHDVESVTRIIILCCIDLSIHVLNASTNSNDDVFILTALVNVAGADGTINKVRAMIDQGSQSSLVSRILLDKLNLPWN